MGKSSIVQALAAADGVACETVIGSLREPSDFAGLPVITEGGVMLSAPSWARRLQDAEHGGYLFLDELTTSAPAVQAAMLGVVLDRRVGDLVLPRSVSVICAANPPERAADGYDLAPPLANRLMHLDYQPGWEDWTDGMTTGFVVPAARAVAEPEKVRTGLSRALVATFVRARPGLLHAFPTTDASTGRAWPSRRTWTMTADLLAVLDPADVEAAHMAATGLVGPGAADEFITWRANADLPDPAEVTADPSIVDWSALDVSRTWAVLTGVVAYATSRGTVEAWRAAWGPLAAAADAGRGDVGAATARQLLIGRPGTARPPRAARAFAKILADAGLSGAPAV